jgi:hypothetical protein
MIDFSFSALPFAVLSLANFVLSWLWYSPILFAKPWLRARGVEPQHEMTAAEKSKMPWLFLSGIVSSCLMTYGMMVIVNSLRLSSFGGGMIAGLALWAGFALTHSLNTLWEGRKPLVLSINNGLFLLTYVLFGGILAVWK